MINLNDRIATWVRAELAGDTTALDDLLHPLFRGVGPFGFVLDRRQWLARFDEGLRYTAFEFTVDGDTWSIDRALFVVGTQTQQGAHQGRAVDGAFRVSLVFTGENCLLTAAHLSLRTPPGPPPAGAGAAAAGQEPRTRWDDADSPLKRATPTPGEQL
jgi:hypothetical protein